MWFTCTHIPPGRMILRKVALGRATLSYPMHGDNSDKSCSEIESQMYIFLKSY